MEALREGEGKRKTGNQKATRLLKLGKLNIFT
jgi:hypothetical protein